MCHYQSLREKGTSTTATDNKIINKAPHRHTRSSGENFTCILNTLIGFIFSLIWWPLLLADCNLISGLLLPPVFYKGVFSDFTRKKKINNTVHWPLLVCYLTMFIRSYLTKIKARCIINQDIIIFTRIFSTTPILILEWALTAVHLPHGQVYPTVLFSRSQSLSSWPLVPEMERHSVWRREKKRDSKA